MSFDSGRVAVITDSVSEAVLVLDPETNRCPANEPPCGNCDKCKLAHYLHYYTPADRVSIFWTDRSVAGHFQPQTMDHNWKKEGF